METLFVLFQHKLPTILIGLAALVLGYLYIVSGPQPEPIVADKEELRRLRAQALEDKRGGSSGSRTEEKSQPHRVNTIAADSDRVNTQKEENRETSTPIAAPSNTTKQTNRDIISGVTDEEANQMIPKKKKAKIIPPAVQLLCEGLSEILETTVRPTTTTTGRWNGIEGWYRPRKSSPGETNGPLLLPLSAHAPTTSSTEEWKDLHHALSSMPIPTLSITMMRAAKAYANCRIQIKKHPQGTACFRVAEQWILEWTRTAMAKDVVDEDEEELPDLFQDDVPTTNDSMLEELLAIPETGGAVYLTKAFLEGLWEADTSLVERVYNQLWRRLEEAWKSNNSSLLQARINAVSHILTHSTSVLGLAAKHFADKTLDATGKEIEDGFPMARLFRIAAYTLPTQFDDNMDQQSLFVKQMETVLLEGDTTGNLGIAFYRNQASPSFHAFTSQVREQMQYSRNACALLFRLSIKSMHKEEVFGWLARLIQANEALTRMLTAELLSSDGITALSSSWSFLLGTGSSLLGLCTSNLQKKFDSVGHIAFDIRYLTANRLGLSNDTGAPLSPNGPNQETKLAKNVRFDGATQFFFLGSGLLHISLYPLLRVDQSFHQRYNDVLGILQDSYQQPENVPPSLRRPSRTAILGVLGPILFLEDPGVASDLTNFALLQLRWILDVARKTRKGEGLYSIPDWFCKEPSRWLARVATTTTNQLKAHQAELAVSLATELLTIGSEDRAVIPGAHAFSPVVLTELVRIASSFVQAGVRKSRQTRRRHTEEDADVDDPSIYLSFDKSHLGTVVFTHDRVCDELCPTLLKAFRAMDVVEGLNVDVEASFDKYSVKLEIANLLILLWGHPNGRCKASMVVLPVDDIANFVCSLGAALNFLLDDALQRYSDACRIQKQSFVSPQDESFMKRQSSGATSNFLAARKLLLLLWKLSKEKRIAAIIGSTEYVAKSLASLVVHFLEILTSSDGGTNPDLCKVGSSSMSLSADSSLDQKTLRLKVSSLVCARREVFKNFGLDVSVLSHQLLALVGLWHKATISDGQSSSAIIEALSTHEDCDIKRYKAIYDRLIPSPADPPTDILQFVVKSDGYVGAEVWADEETTAPTTTEQKRLQSTARVAQMSHTSIQSLVSRATIAQLLETLQGSCTSLLANTDAVIDIDNEIKTVLSQVSTSSNSSFIELLRPFVLSSEPFTNCSDDQKFSHYFDKTARKNGSLAGSGKVLVKEALKCRKRIPDPHPNSSIFVCFEESRMDLCRACVTGPVDTPYSFGIFVFDVYFPPTYPQIPPLLQFMTTGGGQVRFGPNLYQDGKVCLSLLGTFHAADESQQWNPSVSSLAQILLSIQTQLLTSDPYFNEPGHEAMANTGAGRAASEQYNLNRRLENLRHAVLGPLLHPPLGFQDVVQRYFSLCRQQILVQAKRWLLDSRGTSLESRYERVVNQLMVELARLPVDTKCKPISPRKEDVAYLMARDPSFSRWGKDVKVAVPEDSKPAALLASNADDASALAPFNPWANQGASSMSSLKRGDSGEDDEDDFYS